MSTSLSTLTGNRTILKTPYRVRINAQMNHFRFATEIIVILLLYNVNSLDLI